MDMRSSNIATTLGRLRVYQCGEGPALLFWSSLLMSSRMWTAQAAHFSPGYRVILLDPPGHGDSEPLRRLFTFEECARCVVQVLDALQLERTHFVGNSWGGMMGGTLAALHPDRIGKCVLMNCTASPAGLRHRLEYGFLSQLLHTVGRIRGPLAIPALRAFAGPTSERERPAVMSTIRTALKDVDGRSASWAVRSVVPLRPDQHALLARIRTPVLVIAGEEDRVFPVAETRAMATAIAGARFEVLPRTAHLAALENPEPVNALISDFLKERVA